MTLLNDRAAAIFGRIAQALPTAVFVFALATGRLDGMALAALGLTSGVLLFGYGRLTPMMPPDLDEEPGQIPEIKATSRGLLSWRPCSG